MLNPSAFHYLHNKIVLVVKVCGLNSYLIRRNLWMDLSLCISFLDGPSSRIFNAILDSFEAIGVVSPMLISWIVGLIFIN